jgi:drug/metabolite transporter (DMT)-like permease
MNRPPAWAVVLAFGLVYLTWGTTFLAIHAGAREFPPGLFGGLRIAVAGLLLLAWLALRRRPLRLSPREWAGAVFSGACFFVGGNGLVTVGLSDPDMETGSAALLVATTPLWMALLETVWPRGERLTWRGWLGVFAGLSGVLLLLGHHERPLDLLRRPAPFLLLGSAFFWAVGSFLMRHQRRTGPRLTAAAYQMIAGGGCLTLIGLVLGEAGRLTPEHFTPAAVGAFVYLLIFGSLVGFLAFSWLLDHVSVVLAGTYAYVNPLIAVLVGWLLAGEHLTLQVLGGMAMILASVALIRAGGVRPRRAPAQQKSLPARESYATDGTGRHTEEGRKVPSPRGQA